LEHKTGIDLTVSPTLKKPSKNYTCFISRRFGLFLIHLQSENKATLEHVSSLVRGGLKFCEAATGKKSLKTLQSKNVKPLGQT